MTVTTTSEKSHATRLFNLCRLTTPLIKILKNLDKPFADTCGGAPRLEAHPNYNVGPQPIARARAAVGTHTHPFCFYNFKSQTGCVSSATVFTALLMSAFVPPPHLPYFLRVRLLSASVPLQYLRRFWCPPLFRPRICLSFLRVRPLSASVPLQHSSRF